MRLTLFLAIALVLPGSVLSASPDSGIHQFQLENGMQGVVIEDHRAPVVTHMVWYRVGSADEPPGQSGIAHFLEHLMFKATGTLEDGEFSRIVAANGGDDNAFTSNDYTAYFQRIAADRLELVMGMEADRMVNLNPTPEGVLSERDVVLEERRQVVENSPGGPFNEERQAVLYANHPYGKPVIGWAHEIAGFDAVKALSFYREHYAPNNAILVVAGDVEPKEVEDLARRYFGTIPASERVMPRIRPQEPEPRAARRLEYRDERVREPYLTRSYLASHRETGNQKQAAALTVLAEFLGGSNTTSEMARDLQLEKGVAINTGAYYSGTALDPRSFSLYVVPAQGVSLEEAESALDDLIDRVTSEAPEAEKLDRIKSRLRASELFALDNQQRRARRIGGALTSGLSLEDVALWPDELAAVTAEDIRDAAESVFRPEASVTAWLMSEDESGEPVQ